MHLLLQIVNGHVLEIDLLSTIDVGGIGKNANGHARAGDIGKPVRRRQCCESLLTTYEAHLTVPEKRLSLWGS